MSLPLREPIINVFFLSFFLWLFGSFHLFACFGLSLRPPIVLPFQNLSIYFIVIFLSCVFRMFLFFIIGCSYNIHVYFYDFFTYFFILFHWASYMDIILFTDFFLLILPFSISLLFFTLYFFVAFFPSLFSSSYPNLLSSLPPPPLLPLSLPSSPPPPLPYTSSSSLLDLNPSSLLLNHLYSFFLAISPSPSSPVIFFFFVFLSLRLNPPSSSLF